MKIIPVYELLHYEISLAVFFVYIPRRPRPLLSNKQHPSYGDCLDGKRGDYLTSSVLLCIIIVYHMHTYIMRSSYTVDWIGL